MAGEIGVAAAETRVGAAATACFSKTGNPSPFRKRACSVAVPDGLPKRVPGRPEIILDDLGIAKRGRDLGVGVEDRFRVASLSGSQRSS